MVRRVLLQLYLSAYLFESFLQSFSGCFVNTLFYGRRSSINDVFSLFQTKTGLLFNGFNNLELVSTGALEKKGVDAEIFSALKGNTAIMLCNTGNAPAKLIKEFTKGDKTGEAKPQLKAAYVEETIYVGKQNLDFLCTIKSKNELIAELVALLQSPAKNVVSALQSGQNTIHGVLQTLEERAQ